VNYKEQEKFFKEIANQYVETEGANLKREDSSPFVTNPQLDARIRGNIYKKKSLKYFAVIGIAAACILTFLALAQTFSVFKGMFPSSTADISDSTPNEQNPDLIPLSNELPKYFTIMDSKVDNGKSIYTIESFDTDYIILTLEKNADEINTDGLTKMEINNYTTYAKATQEYKYITFINEDVRYTLTCRYDMYNLIDLVEHL